MKRHLALLAVILVALSGCGGQTAAVLSPVRSVSLPVRAPRNMFAQELRQARDLGRIAGRQQVSFLLLLRDPSAARRQAAINAMYDPHSPQFGHFASAAALARTFGPRPGTVNTARRRLAHLGFRTVWTRGNDWMRVEGPARRVERVFGVRIDRYRPANGRTFYAAARQAGVPAWLHSLVAHVGRISNLSEVRPQVIPVNGMSPATLLKAYTLSTLRTQGSNGSGQTIAFIEIDGFDQSDLNGFTQHFGLPAMHPVVKFGGRISHVDGEAELDMEVAHEIAPAARLLVYNCPGNCSESDFINTEQAAVQGNPRGIISVSIGGCEEEEDTSALQAEQSTFARADALGESVLVASGDSGAFECLTRNWGAAPTRYYIGTSSPAILPGVTAVGGTRLSLNRDGTWYREESWVVPPQTAGTGGGVSQVFARPGWQHGAGVNNQYDTAGKREIPDVSAAADPLSSAQIDVGGSLIEEGGTSQAAPIWAGMMALINQYLKAHGGHVAGFLNPALYTLANSSQPYPPLHDITVGNNLVYPATSGYDLATGLGSPQAWNLARDFLAYQKGGH